MFYTEHLSNLDRANALVSVRDPPTQPSGGHFIIPIWQDNQAAPRMARPHVVVVPYPGSGNVNPALQLAKLLHRHGAYVTFVNTEHNHRRVQDTEGAGAVRGREGFRFETIPDGLSEADRGKQDYGTGLALSITTRCAAPFRALVERLNGDEPGVPRVTCVLATMLMGFAIGVARELRIPTMVFWTTSAASLMADMRLRDLEGRGYVPLKDESYLTNGYVETTVIDWIPGMPPMNLGDLSSFLRTTDPDDFCLRLIEAEANNCSKAGALILNTFDSLEAEVLAALRAEYPRIYTIGTLGSLLRRGAAATDDNSTDGDDSPGLSLWKQDAECLAWLDTQAPRSVVYVNFGSHTVLSPEQLAEFAWGLAASGHTFLWSIRDDLVRGGGGGLAALPPAFTAETAGRCRVTAWCPQEQVLRHPAVDGFLTHSGWNSTCESVAAGVPMACWPGFADQYTNCRYACEAWGIGVRLDAEVRREQVAERVREVMASGEMRRNVARWKTEAAAATSPGGSSYENFLAMVTALRSSSNCSQA
nr:7-deoxyloganetin glucosyltransferase-like [Setaria viridis]